MLLNTSLESANGALSSWLLHPYDLQTQAKIPAALAALHNFIRIYDPGDDAQGADDHDEGPNIPPAQEIHPEHLGGHISQAEKDCTSSKRDVIAQAMWVDYQNILSRWGQLWYPINNVVVVWQI